MDASQRLPGMQSNHPERGATVELSETQKKREERVRKARELAAAVPQILDGGTVPSQVLQGFALMVEGLLAEVTDEQ